MKRLHKAMLATSALILFCNPAFAQVPTPTPLVTPNIGFSNQPSGGAFTMGYTFTVNAVDERYIVALGAYDAGADGFPGLMQVGLWDSGGALLLQSQVSSANTLIGNFRYASVAPYLLTSGETYYIGAFQYSGAGETYATAPGGVTMPDGISFGQAQYDASGVFTRPADPAGTTGYFGAGALIQDSSAVPEPASWALMIGGFGVAGAAMRRRARQRLAA